VLFCLANSKVHLEFELTTLEQCYLMLIENAKIKKCFEANEQANLKRKLETLIGQRSTSYQVDFYLMQVG